jgi:hypothetical protein
MNMNERGQQQPLQEDRFALSETQGNWAWALKWDSEALAAISVKRGLDNNGTNVSREDPFSSHC